MNHVPGGKEVERSLKNTLREVKSAQRQVNQYAARLVARGDYAGAEQMLAVGRRVLEFWKEIETVRSHWRELRGKSKTGGAPEKPKTPLWRYYAPTLRALIELGGTATREDIERHIESKPSLAFAEGDLAPLGGRPRWKVMIQRSLRPMLKEGFLQREKRLWKITPAGRKAAETESAKEPGK